MLVIQKEKGGHKPASADMALVEIIPNSHTVTAGCIRCFLTSTITMVRCWNYLSSCSALALFISWTIIKQLKKYFCFLCWSFLIIGFFGNALFIPELSYHQQPSTPSNATGYELLVYAPPGILSITLKSWLWNTEESPEYSTFSKRWDAATEQMTL